METVLLDLNKYLKRNIFPCRTVLVFPPFNGFRRFLIHKLIEDSFSSADVAAFSIGQDIRRRIVVCYKGLIRDNQNKVAPPSLPPISTGKMIEKERHVKTKSSPTVGVYRPPAARIAESRQSKEDATPETKRSRVRRPDQQMYVPRPKRVSYGNDQPSNRSRSSSRTSFESDSCEKTTPLVPHKSDELRLSGSIKPVSEERQEFNTETPESLPKKPSENTEICDEEVNRKMAIADLKTNADLSPPQNNSEERIEIKEIVTPRSYSRSNSSVTDSENGRTSEVKTSCSSCETEKKEDKVNKMNSSPHEKENEKDSIARAEESVCANIEVNKVDVAEPSGCSNVELMETISISSDSRGDHSCVSAETSDDSRSSETSLDSEEAETPSGQRNQMKMEVELLENKKEDISDKVTTQEKNKKNRRIFPNSEISDVLIISDSNSSSDISSEITSKSKEKKVSKGSLKKSSSIKEKDDKTVTKSRAIDPEACDWESLYDDSGECLVPDLMEELTSSVGNVRVTSVDSDYRQYQSIEERTNDGECVIEIYDFPAEFKTTDLINIFAAYRDRNFQIKWVDDTHALGVFPSPLMADEVLGCTLPFVKTRPLRLGIAESRMKARNLVLPALPAMERPKTCPALARRLVSGALGLRLPTSTQDRERERQLLKEARDKRRLEAKQREAAWEGTLTSSSCI